MSKKSSYQLPKVGALSEARIQFEQQTREALEYLVQAQIDGEVYVFQTWPNEFQEH